MEETEIEEVETNEFLFDAGFSAEDWVVNDTDYDSTSSDVSKVTSNGILLKAKGTAGLKTGTFTTEERVKLIADFTYVDNIPSYAQTFEISMYENDSIEPYYSFSRQFTNPKQSFEITGIIPRIRANTQIKITAKTASGKEVRIESLKLYSVCESDWNFADNYNSRIGATSVSPNTRHLQTNVKSLPGYNGNEGAIANENLVGITKIQSGYTQSVDKDKFESGGLFVIRMVNLSEKEQTVKVDDESYILQFGENDIITEYGESIDLPFDPNVMLVSICQYENTNEDKGVYYSLIEGMSDNYVR